MIRSLRKLFGVQNPELENEQDAIAHPRLPRASGQQPLVTHNAIGQTLVVTIVERELNSSTAPEVCYDIKELYTSQAGVRHIVLDLENIKYVDSAGLNSMVDLLSVVKKRHGRLGIAAAMAQVEVLFKLTRLELVFTIRRTVLDAVDAIEPKG